MHPFPHSMTLLKAIVEDPPPFAPEPALDAARATYERFRTMPPAHAHEIEDAIIAYGRVLWPYRKAFASLVWRELTVREEALFVEALPADLRARYLAYRARGGSLVALHDQRVPDGAFTAVELGALCAALVTARRTAAERTRAAIAADPTAYRALIQKFQAIQHEVEAHIAALRRLADRVADHEEVRAEIVETVRMFERGLAALAREPEARAVCAAIEAYRERHEIARERRVREARPRIFSAR